MTQSKKLKPAIDEAERAMIATDRAGDYLYQNHRDHAAEIAMRALHRMALLWKAEQHDRFVRKDPREVFTMSNDYVRRLHERTVELPLPSQSDAMAEHFIITLLADFDADRAWLISHNIYHRSAWPPPYRFWF